MAERIGNEPIGFVHAKVDIRLNVPLLLSNICVSEEHIKHIQAVQLLSGLLDAIAIRSLELNDPLLLELMFKMKLLKVVEKDEGVYDDI